MQMMHVLVLRLRSRVNSVLVVVVLNVVVRERRWRRWGEQTSRFRVMRMLLLEIARWW